LDPPEIFQESARKEDERMGNMISIYLFMIFTGAILFGLISPVSVVSILLVMMVGILGLAASVLSVTQRRLTRQGQRKK
jgi:hypothetical protein